MQQSPIDLKMCNHVYFYFYENILVAEIIIIIIANCGKEDDIDRLIINEVKIGKIPPFTEIMIIYAYTLKGQKYSYCHSHGIIIIKRAI